MTKEIKVKKHIQYGNVWVTPDTDPEFAKFLSQANISRRRVMITYHEKFANFGGYHNKDGTEHRMYIGRSTGTYKIPLEIHRQDSIGGGGLLTGKDVVKSWKYV